MTDVAPVDRAVRAIRDTHVQNHGNVTPCQPLASSSSISCISPNPNSAKSGQPKKSKIDFSIEAILARSPPVSPPVPSQDLSKGPEHKNRETVTTSTIICPQINSSQVHQHELSWVHCTRYRPPKLPRVKKEMTFRTRYRNPRIPFSTAEVAALERKFRSSPYLGSHDVVELAAVLNMSPKRIKIWFQNRRARERRENDVQ